MTTKDKFLGLADKIKVKKFLCLANILMSGYITLTFVDIVAQKPM
jgi:hypothetical protein